MFDIFHVFRPIIDDMDVTARFSIILAFLALNIVI